ncbi:MAG: hypothetical protein IK096_00820, partial [Lachnospiraceae bacterium]|nr:hypothetical protein [Lachnospiraceae bacterium]
MPDDHQNDIREYVERMKEIRLLSTPDLQDIRDANDYSSILVRNFSRIGELAVENRKLVDDFIKPILSSRGNLTAETREKLKLFSELLVDDDAFAEVDSHLSEALNDLLLTANIESAKDIDADPLVMLMAKKV